MFVLTRYFRSVTESDVFPFGCAHPHSRSSPPVSRFTPLPFQATPGQLYTDAEVVTMIKALLARPIQAEGSLLPLPPPEMLPPLLEPDAGADVEVDAATIDACLALLEALPRCAWKGTAHGFLHMFLQQSGVTPLTDNKAPPAEASSIVSEEAVLAQFLLDLTLLMDYELLQFLPSTVAPSTVAASALFLSRTVLDHLSRAPLTLTDSHGLILTSPREAPASFENCRPFVARDPTFTSRSFGHPTLGAYIRSSFQEIQLS